MLSLYLSRYDVLSQDHICWNVLIKRLESGRLQAVVGDFGLSTNIPDVNGKTKLCTVGSPYWMSPECLKGLYYDEQSDVFSYGIVLCELIARVEADPDYLPRTDNFGLDYLAFSELCGPNVVPDFLTLAFRCCAIEPKSRPTFTEIIRTLSDILTDMKKVADKEARMASCAAKSEEQLPVLSVQSSVPQHRKTMTFDDFHGGLQHSSRIAALRRSLEKHNNSSGPSGSNSLLPHQRPKCSRLVVCEGAVRSKLPLFDKK
ncbi:hypothetical protein NQ317_016889 [Molorchus minor]|uniref:Protein kinase domain-containing protein n=1 Tax=Molorchus minor TaxID=1323400 RepID=A0ABQ9K2X5_9CUCU|nr:hypothetical protein NQ317_016889 [Molorchus minor]